MAAHDDRSNQGVPIGETDESPPPGERGSLHDWMSEGACLDEDPELFFPVGVGAADAEQAEQATAICHRCAVEAECLRFALANYVRDGIWGGRTAPERTAMIRDRRQRRSRRRSRRGPNGRASWPASPGGRVQ